MSEKSNINNLELGNIIFNENKNQEFVCPNWVIALLKDIKDRLSVAFWNQYQLDLPSPFDNSGNTYEGKTFTVSSHDWSSEYKRPYNFKYKNIEISWYKYLGRDTTINGDYSPEEIIEMYDNIINEINNIT